jgi:hypothetical protein
MHALLLLAFFTCHYPGYVSKPCQDQLVKTVRYMQAHPNTVVEMVNGDDETGEFLTANGIEASRIGESKQAGGMLILKIRRAPHVKLIVPIRPTSTDPRDATLGCP